jgi:hypothetical protein
MPSPGSNISRLTVRDTISKLDTWVARVTSPGLILGHGGQDLLQALYFVQAVYLVTRLRGQYRQISGSLLARVYS